LQKNAANMGGAVHDRSAAWTVEADVQVLVVDDEGFVAELVSLALEADGHACFTAGTLDEATEILRSVRVDLVTLDLTLDGRDSIGWLEEAVLANPDLHGRVFVLTGRPVEASESPRIHACGARVVYKPFTLQQLRETVRMLVPIDPRPVRPRTGPPVVEP
jgi:DNA-binding response OmpR family regulator